MRKETKQMLTDDILNNLSKISRHPFFMFKRKLDDRGDNGTQMLDLLASEKDVTAGRIAEVLDIKPSSVTQMIKKLEMAGIVDRIKSERDARVTYVNLTSVGQEMYAAREKMSGGLNSELFKGFSQEELVAFSESVEKLASQLSSAAFQDKLNQEFGNDERWKIFEKINSRMGQARGRMMCEFDQHQTEFGFQQPFWDEDDMRGQTDRRRGDRLNHNRQGRRDTRF